MRLAFTNAYPPDWPDIAEQVKVEAGQRCVRCKHPRGDRVIRTRSLDRVAAIFATFTTCLVRSAQDGTGFHQVTVRVPCAPECSHPADAKLRTLTVHHLDGDKANLRWWNLLALCQVCHLQVQARVLPERPWLFPHTPWFRIYVAGFYAWYYGKLELTREETAVRIEELLALGQPWLANPEAAHAP